MGATDRGGNTFPRREFFVFSFPILAVLFLAAFSFAASSVSPLDQQYRLRVSENDSLRSIAPISENFPYAGCNSIPEDYNGRCSAFVYDFCIESSGYISSNVQLNSDESSGELKGSYDSLVSSDRYLQKLKDRWFNVFLTSFNCTIDRDILGGLSFATYLASCEDIPKDQILDLLFGDYGVDALVGIDNYHSSQTGSYENGARAINLLMESLSEQADSLYYEGAGYPNYSSKASAFYDQKIRTLISDYKSGRLDPQRDSYAYLYVRDIAFSVNNDSKLFSDCEMGIMHSENYFSAYENLLGIYREALSQRAQLKSDYDTLMLRAEETYGEANSKLDSINEWEYHLVDSRIIAYAANGSQSTVLESDVSSIPSNAIAQIESSLHGSGSQIGAKPLIDRAKNGARDKTEFYYAAGMERLSSSVSLSAAALNISDKVEARVSGILETLESLAVQKIERTSADVEDYSVWDIATASVSDSLNEKLNAALDFYNDYDPSETTKGERIFNLYSACLILDEIDETVALKAWDVKSEKLKELNSSLLSLNSVIKLAKTDGIDVTAEETLAESKSVLLSLEVSNITFIDQSVSAIREAELGIYSKAGAQFSSLKDLRERLYGILESLGKYVDVSGYVSEIESRLGAQESYFAGGDFVPEKTLGSYLKIRGAYNSILGELDRKSSAILGEYLSSRYYLTNSFDSVPAVGSYANITTYIELKNDLMLSSSKPVTVSMKNVPFAANSLVNSDYSGIYAAKNGTGIVLYISNISQNKTYYITIKTGMKPAVLNSKSAERISLSETRLVEKIKYNIDSEFEIESLVFEDGYGADSCTVYMDGNLQNVRSHSNLSVALSGVKAGRSVVEATCVRNEPISFLSSNFTEEDNYITYLFRLKSNYEELEDFEYVMQLLGSASEIDPASIRIAEESGAVPDKFSSYKLGDRYYAKWTVDSLSSEYINYTVQYRVTDIVSYYAALKADVENSSYREAVDVSNFIRDAEYKASTGNYNTAIDSLEKAKKTITIEINKKIEKDSLAERLDKISGQISQLKNRSSEIYEISANLSLSGVSVEIAKQIAEYDSNVKDARALLDSGDVSGAKSLIKELERLVSSNKIDDVLYSKEKKVTGELFEMQNLLFSLGKFTDVGSLLEEVDAIRQEISVVAPATSVSDYYSALTHLNNAVVYLDRLGDSVENHSESASVRFSIALENSKSAINNWKKQKEYISSTFSVSKSNPIQSVPSSVIQIISTINETEASAAGLEVLYSRLKSYDAEEMLSNSDEFEELALLSENVSSGIGYLSNFTSRYKAASNEIIKDIAVLFEEKLKSGTGEEKRKVAELQPIFASAKSSYNSGLYLDSMLMGNYIRNSVLYAGDGQIDILDPVFLYLGILVGSLVVFAYIFTRKRAPKEPKKIEKIKLD